MTSTLTPADSLRRVLGWLIVPVIIVMQFVDLRRGLFAASKSLVSVDLVLYSAVVVVCLPWTIKSLRTTASALWWVMVPFVTLCGYALVSALFVRPPEVFLIGYGTGLPTVSGLVPERIDLVMPTIMALLALAAAASLVAVMPARLRLRQLWVASAVLVATTYLSWPRRIGESDRLSAGIGGAAVIFSALLLTLAMFLASYRAGLWRVASLVGAGMSALAIVLSGSRSGLICLVVFIVVAFAGLVAKRTLPRPVAWGIGALVAVLGALLVLIPEAQRLLSFSDELRQINLRASWVAWTESWHSLLLGQGSGRVWPWYLYESTELPIVPRIVTTTWGEALPHAHSTFLAVLVELGLVGFVVLAVMLVGVGRILVVGKRWGRPSFLVAAAIVATIPGWLFDTFLIKNFPLALWWWFVLIAVFGFRVFADERVASSVSAEQPVAQPDAVVGRPTEA